MNVTVFFVLGGACEDLSIHRFWIVFFRIFRAVARDWTWYLGEGGTALKHQIGDSLKVCMDVPIFGIFLIDFEQHGLFTMQDHPYHSGWHMNQFCMIQFELPGPETSHHERWWLSGDYAINGTQPGGPTSPANLNLEKRALQLCGEDVPMCIMESLHTADSNPTPILTKRNDAVLVFHCLLVISMSQQFHQLD